MKNFGNRWVEGFSFHHKGRGLEELDTSEQYGYKLWEFYAIVDNIKSIIKSFKFIVIVIELYEAKQIPEFREYLIVPKEMKNVLVCHA